MKWNSSRVFGAAALSLATLPLTACITETVVEFVRADDVRAEITQFGLEGENRFYVGRLEAVYDGEPDPVHRAAAVLNGDTLATYMPRQEGTGTVIHGAYPDSLSRTGENEFELVGFSDNTQESPRDRAVVLYFK